MYYCSIKINWNGEKGTEFCNNNERKNVARWKPQV